MGTHYSHISPKERIEIYRYLLQGLSISAIAEKVGFHRATVYRELTRNSCKHGYRSDWASQQALARRSKVAKLDQNSDLATYVTEKLQEGWSPEQIAGRLKQEGSDSISHESIYAWIYSLPTRSLKLYQLLRKKRRFRFPRIRRKRHQKSLEEKIFIKERDETINQRQTEGHWEGDLILFKGCKMNLFTLRERKTRFIAAIKNSSRQAAGTANTLIRYMKEKLPHTLKTLTLDNDTAFALHATIATSLGGKIYFCEPYKSYQKGAIENANRLLRTKFPRDANIYDLSQSLIDSMVDSLNDRPMKCLGFKTPKEEFLKYFGFLPV